MTRRRPDLFAVCAMLVNLLLAIRLRTVAWPEVTTPAYLISRGFLLYRDIKFVHTPVLMESLGLFFRVFGVNAAVIRVFAMLGPLTAHALILRETRSAPLSARFWTSAFFLSLFYSWQGNAIWPSVLISAFALPTASALGRDRMRAAGLWVGLIIAIKQTGGLLLVTLALVLAAKRRFRDALVLVLFASLPYAAAALLFTLAGAGRDFLTWTLVAPFQIAGLIRLLPSPWSLLVTLAGFVPAAIQTALEEPDEYRVATRWYLWVGVGLALVSFPRFGFLESVACVPCMAIGAFRLMRRPKSRQRRLAFAFVSVFAATTAATFLAGDALDGKVQYWNDTPEIVALVERLRAFPPDTLVDAEIWENILPQTGMLPPGHWYVHPLLVPFIAPVDSVGERLRRTRDVPGVLRVRRNTGQAQGEIIQKWYLIENASTGSR